MIHVEVLERSVAFPLELNSTVDRQGGIPVEVQKQCAQFKPWFLVAWHDEVSGTIGFLNKNHVMVFQRDNVVGLALNFMTPAKGPGLVSLDVHLKTERKSPALLYSPMFRQEAVDWVIEKKSKIESIFSMPITVFDRGSDY